MSSSLATSTLSLETHLSSSPSEQLCYVHCNICDTVLAVRTKYHSTVHHLFSLSFFLSIIDLCFQVSVPYSSLFKTVTVRCGHCSNLLSVNMRALHMQPPPLNPLNFSCNTNSGFFTPSHTQTNLLVSVYISILFNFAYWFLSVWCFRKRSLRVQQLLLRLLPQLLRLLLLLLRHLHRRLIINTKQTQQRKRRFDPEEPTTSFNSHFLSTNVRLIN